MTKEEILRKITRPKTLGEAFFNPDTPRMLDPERLAEFLAEHLGADKVE